MTKNQKYVVYALVAVAVVYSFFLAFHRSAPSAPTTGLVQTDLGQFPEGVRNGDLFERWETATLPAGQNSVALFTNRSGRDVYVDYGSVDVPTGQIASSSSKVSLFATTSSSTAIPTVMDFQTVTEGKRALIQNMPIATSTTATTTSSVIAAVTARANGNGAIVVPDGSTVFGYLQQDLTGAPVSCSALQRCETATSSNRGFNPIFNVKIYYQP